MNTTTKLLGSLLITATAVSCGTGSQNHSADVKDPLANSPVVGQYVQVGNDKVMSCDQKLLTDTVRLPLSFFTEEMDIIRLDNRDEALIGETAITASENYLLTHTGYPPKPIKLFDKKGNYLTDIGSIGQGPGEYQNVYDIQLDEANDRIYVMPWQSAQLLVYDLKGNVLNPIPLCLRCPKSKFRVDTKNETVSVVVLPFEGLPAVAWTQDMKGNQQSYIAPGHLGVPMDFSNEVSSGFNMQDVFDVNILSIMPTRIDSLYRYDIKNNRMQPTFTMKFTADPIPWHGYGEWADYYTGDVSAPPVQVPGGWQNGETIFYLIDKKTCRGAYFRLYNDFFGNENIGWPSMAFSNGYYVRNIEPGNLLTDIENALKNKNLSDAKRKKLTDLQSTIGENDNNYIMIAKLKK